MKSPRPAWVSWLAWGLVLLVANVFLLHLRDDVRESHVALTFLLVVVGASASGARGLGTTLAVLCFLLIDYYYQPPFGTLSVAKSLDWVVLIAFLTTSIVATQLLEHARDAAARADVRTREVERLMIDAERTAALEEADRLKDALLASVSHDLRTPLTTIRALGAEIAEGGDDNAAEIVIQVDRLDRIVRDLLDLSRINAGQAATMEINTAEDLIGAALRQLAAPLRGRRVQSKIVGDEVLVGRFDFVQSLRALTNLIDNAVKYSSHDSMIEMTARREPAFVAIDVADRGPGVTAGEEERIFLPFYRPPGSPPDAGGAGLGLAIAKRLAEAQGGRLSFEPRDGGGSVFTLRLPAADIATG